MRIRRSLRLIPILALLLSASLGAGGVNAENPPLPTDADIQSAADRLLEQTKGGGSDPWVVQTIKVHSLAEPGSAEANGAPVALAIIYEMPLKRDCTVGTSKQMCVSPFWPYALDYNYTTRQWDFEARGGGNDSDALKDTVESFMAKTLAWFNVAEGWLPGVEASGEPTDSPSPTPEPELPLCDAAIIVPPNLKVGDTLSPEAAVTSTDGAPLTGSFSTVWVINGVSGNSVTWDGKPANIVLQLSCQGHAQEFRATYNGTLTQESPAPVTSSAPEPSGSTGPGESAGPEESTAPQPGDDPSTGTHGRGSGAIPGLGGVGSVPGPADPLGALGGMLVPGILGVLGGLLLAGGAGGGTPPVSPTGPTPGTGSGSSGDGPKPTEPTEPPTPYESGDAATQVAITKLAGAMNRAAALHNPAMIDAISQAQAEAFDADGKVIPEKMAAAWQIIRGSTGGRPGQLPEDAEIPWAVTDAAKAGLWAVPTFLGMAGGAVVTIAKGAGNLGVGAVKGIGQIGDALWNYKMFDKGLDTEIKNFVEGQAAAETNEVKAALKDGRYLDALGAQGRGITKAAGAPAKALGVLGDKLWAAARDMLPVDEIETFNDPNASFEQKMWAVPSGVIKTAAILVGFEGAAAKAVPGIRPSATFIPSAVPGYQATEAAAAAAAKAAQSGGTVRAAAQSMQASATAAAKVERLAADVLGGKAAPASLREGALILKNSPELRALVDQTLIADGKSGSIRALAQDGVLGSDAHNLITARRIEQSGQAMNNAAGRIAREEAEGWIKAHTDPATGLVDYSAAPRRLLTSQASEGNRGFISGAHAGTDLDRTFYTRYVSTTRANQILGEEAANLGFSRNSLGTNAYTARPGTLMDTSGSAGATNNEAWLRRNYGQITSESGSVQTHISSNGTITTGPHVGGSRGADVLGDSGRFGASTGRTAAGGQIERFGAPVQLTPAQAAASVTHQLEGLAGAGKNLSDGAKYAARAIKDGATFDGAEAILRAAGTKDPATAAAILREAGIDSVADLQARLRP